MVELDEHRRRIIAEVSAFITWGLAHPDEVRRIPRRPVGEGGFSQTMQRVFWQGIFAASDMARGDVVRRFLRWVRRG